MSPYFLFCHPYFSFVTLRRKPKGLLWRFFAIVYSEKDEILHSADASLRMTPFVTLTLSQSPELIRRVCEGFTKSPEKRALSATSGVFKSFDIFNFYDRIKYEEEEEKCLQKKLKLLVEQLKSVLGTLKKY